MTQQHSSSKRRQTLIAIGCDAALLTVFALSGRNSHHLTTDLAGIWQTLWPFLTGAALAWVVFVHKRPFSPLFGLALMAVTVVVGMTLRIVCGIGTFAPPFIIVATLTLALFFAGWRLVAAAIQRLNRTPRED